MNMLHKYEVCMCVSVCLYTQVNTLDLSPAGTLLATGTKEGILTVWDVSSPLPLHQLTCHSGNIHQVAFSPGEQPPHLCLNRKRWKWFRPVLILLCVCVQTVDTFWVLERTRVWPSQMYRQGCSFQLYTQKKHRGEMSTWDARVGAWTRMCLTVCTLFRCFLWDGSTVLTGGLSGTLSVWNLLSSKVIQKIPAHSGEQTHN